MLFKCPDCGRIKKYLSWKFPDKSDQQEVEQYQGQVAIKLVKCPMCRIKLNNNKGG
jgi:hypothetical protein